MHKHHLDHIRVRPAIISSAIRPTLTSTGVSRFLSGRYRQPRLSRVGRDYAQNMHTTHKWTPMAIASQQDYNDFLNDKKRLSEEPCWQSFYRLHDMSSQAKRLVG